MDAPTLPARAEQDELVLPPQRLADADACEPEPHGMPVVGRDDVEEPPAAAVAHELDGGVVLPPDRPLLVDQEHGPDEVLDLQTRSTECAQLGAECLRARGSPHHRN